MLRLATTHRKEQLKRYVNRAIVGPKLLVIDPTALASESLLLRELYRCEPDFMSQGPVMHALKGDGLDDQRQI